MIPCAVFKCHHPATHGAIYRHESNGTKAHPVYYYCDQHAGLTQRPGAWHTVEGSDQ